MTFIPEKPRSAGAFKRDLPFFEDVSSEKARGGSLSLPIERYQQDIVATLARLDAYNVTFTAGVFEGKPRRYGYAIEFVLAAGVPGRIECAALPIRNETATRKDRALAQALYLVGQRLLSEVDMMTYMPGSVPLVPYLIGTDGRTMTAILTETALPALKLHYLPALPSGEGS